MTPDNLRQCRRNLNLTQKQLAQELGVTSDTLSRWEKGKHKIDPITQRALLCYFNHKEEAK